MALAPGRRLDGDDVIAPLADAWFEDLERLKPPE